MTAPAQSGEPTVAATAVAVVDRRRYHRNILAAAAVVLLVAVLLHGDGIGPLRLPWFDVPLPVTCSFRSATGLDCPGCGLSRSFVALARGRPGDAWRLNPAGLLFFAFLLAQFPYRLWQLRRLARGRPEARLPLLGLLPWLLLGVLLVQWLLRSLPRLAS